MVYPWFEPAPSKILLHLVCNGRRRRFRPQDYCPTRRGRCFKLYYKYPCWYTCYLRKLYRLNIMFRHMPVPRDTSVLRQIIIVCCESVGNCQTLSKDGPSQLVNSIIFRPFLLSSRPMPIFSYQFCPIPTCAHNVFCTLFSYLSIDSSLYHVIFSHVTVFSVFFVKSKVELCDPQCEFWLLISQLIVNES